MNEKITDRESRLRRERLRQTALRSWGMYLLALVAWVATVLGMALLCAILCSSVIWQATPLYWFLQWVKTYIVLVMGAAEMCIRDSPRMIRHRKLSSEPRWFGVKAFSFDSAMFLWAGRFCWPASWRVQEEKQKYEKLSCRNTYPETPNQTNKANPIAPKAIPAWI